MHLCLLRCAVFIKIWKSMKTKLFLINQKMFCVNVTIHIIIGCFAFSTAQPFHQMNKKQRNVHCFRIFRYDWSHFLKLGDISKEFLFDTLSVCIWIEDAFVHCLEYISVALRTYTIFHRSGEFYYIGVLECVYVPICMCTSEKNT